MTKMIKISKVIVVDEEVELNKFLESKAAHFEFIDENLDTSYMKSYGYPDESFILVLQEYDCGDICYSEIGYVICPDEPKNMRKHVLDNMDSFVEL
ncbi:hypothetical protein GAP32_168 [Cronobacter phage vB_CsaM_GAP32]|uniref:Uncharacterized protein n=1 Tax=Cronobacter phage vB_CsaM_GAP32 TaxID=1141136 RepID=K4F6P3_9CAUD|nr:hypothetical protein GAP32_168 [Cronobacter phage vB_CsaM_GAP32]AFC21618.1 hypothetical protein GAP32_168 [Cronobacter phage vB_CsaM_GAP32]